MYDSPPARQAGIVTAAQAQDRGLTRDAVRARLRGGRWQRIFPGIYATFSGPLPRPSLLWAALLLGSPDAVLSHETAAELDELVDHPSPAIHVTVPLHRVVRARREARLPRVVFHRATHLADLRHPARMPPRTRIEETVLDLAHGSTDLDVAVSWPALGCQRRLTTPVRLLTALAGRKKISWRRELREALGDVADGAHTLLEIRYYRWVERAHELPRGSRQARKVRRGLVQYDDVDYGAYGIVVELDGGIAHPEWDTSRDRRRDNLTVEFGGAPLRYGWGDITHRPCETAQQLARTFIRRGWTGKPRACGRPGCVFT